MVACGVLALHENADAAELRLAKDFKVAQLAEMPREASGQWRFARSDYPGFSASEWQVRLRASDAGENPLFEKVDSADFVAQFLSESAFTLHWSKGSHDQPSDFQPRDEVLVKGKAIALESFGGRSSGGAMRYVNLASEGGGLILAVGWTGDGEGGLSLAPH
jgi:hypothetical protein